MHGNHEFDMTDLDDILAEFSEDSSAPAKRAPERPKGPAEYTAPASEKAAPAPEKAAPTLKVRMGSAAAPRSSAAAPVPGYRVSEPVRRAAPNRGASGYKPAPAVGRAEPVGKPERRGSLMTGFVGLIFALLSLAALLLVAVYVHPGAGSANAASDTSLRLSDKLDTYMNNAASDALSGLTHIRKIYRIDENDTVAPAPDASRYGTVAIEDAAKVLDVIQQARDSGLLDGQEVIFDPAADFYGDSDIQYYCDETILVICWKELIDGNTCSCVEIKVADASQLRRKIADDTYGSSNQYYATTMAKQANAVVAMNADFYQFRDFGIVAYQRKLYRFSDFPYAGKYYMYNCIDNCFVTAGGDFLFMRKGEETTAEAVQQFIDDNDVLFTIAFGPVLVDDGVVQVCDWYPAGEPLTGYSRAGIGQLDTLHYFYMSLNHSPKKAARWTVNEFAQRMAEKGVVDAYGLDGGQTSEVVFQGVPYNYIDFGSERSVSDIIYFATALPSEEVAG